MTVSTPSTHTHITCVSERASEDIRDDAVSYEQMSTSLAWDTNVREAAIPPGKHVMVEQYITTREQV